MTRQLGQKSQNSDVLRMFPTFVWKAELTPEVYKPINDPILQTPGEIGTPLAGLMSGENWQSGHALHELERIREVVDCINEGR